MERRQLLAWMGGLGAAGTAAAAGAPGNADRPLQLAQASPAPHDHAAMMAATPSPRVNDKLMPPYQACVQAAQACIAHCQQLLAQGDKSLGACLRTALDTDTVCSAVLRLAGLNSKFTGAMARQSVAVMQACVEACKEHVDHHAECKSCHDACLKAIEAAKGAA